jgi:hypothetical protein
MGPDIDGGDTPLVAAALLYVPTLSGREEREQLVLGITQVDRMHGGLHEGLLLWLVPKQRKLPLLSIELPQGAHNRFHHQELVCCVASIERAALHPGGLALFSRGQFALRLGNLFAQ